MRYSFLLGLLFFLSCCCCDDGPYEDCPEHYFSSSFKSYVFHNDGSYWVYKDTTYGVTDSVYLIDQKVGFRDRCDYNDVPTEYVEHKIYSSFYGNHDSFPIVATAQLKKYNKYFTPPMGYFSSLAASEDNLLIKIHDSMKVQGEWYYNVKQFESREEKAYWAKNVGLVKKTFSKGTNEDTVYRFELVRYQLK